MQLKYWSWSQEANDCLGRPCGRQDTELLNPSIGSVGVHETPSVQNWLWSQSRGRRRDKQSLSSRHQKWTSDLHASNCSKGEKWLHRPLPSLVQCSSSPHIPPGIRISMHALSFPQKGPTLPCEHFLSWKVLEVLTAAFRHGWPGGELEKLFARQEIPSYIFA